MTEWANETDALEQEALRKPAHEHLGRLKELKTRNDGFRRGSALGLFRLESKVLETVWHAVKNQVDIVVGQKEGIDCRKNLQPGECIPKVASLKAELQNTLQEVERWEADYKSCGGVEFAGEGDFTGLLEAHMAKTKLGNTQKFFEEQFAISRKIVVDNAEQVANQVRH